MPKSRINFTAPKEILIFDFPNGNYIRKSFLQIKLSEIGSKIFFFQNSNSDFSKKLLLALWEATGHQRRVHLTISGSKIGRCLRTMRPRTRKRHRCMPKKIKQTFSRRARREPKPKRVRTCQRRTIWTSRCYQCRRSRRRTLTNSSLT